MRPLNDLDSIVELREGANDCMINESEKEDRQTDGGMVGRGVDIISPLRSL